MIVYKKNINILELLKNKGCTQYIMRKNKIFGQAEIEKMRKNETPSIKTLDKLCNLLSCDICDLVEYRSDNKEY